MNLPLNRAGIAPIDEELSRGAMQQAPGKIFGVHLGRQEARDERGGQRKDQRG